MTTSLSYLPITANWKTIAWNGTVFCTVAGSGTTAATSTNGVDWIARTLPQNQNWVGIAWNGSVFCAISASRSIALSSNGSTWSLHSLPVTVTYAETIISFNGLFIVNCTYVGIYTSSDGINWTTNNSLSGLYFTSFGCNDSIVIAKEGTNLYTSTNGINWTSQYAYPLGGGYQYAWNGTIFCSTSGSFGNKYITSTDGITWIERTFPSAQTWNGIIWNGTVFCVIAYNSTAALTSVDGINWTSRTLPAIAKWTRMIWNGTIMCAISGTDNKVATSTDGTWQDYELNPAFWTNFKGQTELLV